jgi:hypothetical protein
VEHDLPEGRRQADPPVFVADVIEDGPLALGQFCGRRDHLLRPPVNIQIAMSVTIVVLPS